MNLLSADDISDALSGTARSNLDSLEVFSEIDSTNSYLLGQPGPDINRYRVALAEFQSAGRGRMDRRWHSPRSSGLCMSVAYTFGRMPERLPSLSLAIGSGIAETLQGLGVRDIGLKWPNDIYLQDAKICGILSEVAPKNPQGCTVVTGIGLNVDFGNADMQEAGAPGQFIDLASCSTEIPSRSALAAILMSTLFETMQRFSAAGLAHFLPTWNRYDWLRGKNVKVDTAAGLVCGVADGVDPDGALLLNCHNTVRHLMSGSVTLDNGARACAPVES